MDEKQLEMYNALKDLGSEEMLDVILNYHGTQLLSSDFYDELVDQGIIEGTSDDDDEDEDEESLKTIEEIAEYLGWTTEFQSENQICFYQTSPAGEDFSFCIDGNEETTLEDITTSIRKYADDFDVDEHAEMWLPSRGKGGCPDTITGLLEDAQEIKNMIEEFAKFLEKREYGE